MIREHSFDSVMGRQLFSVLLPSEAPLTDLQLPPKNFACLLAWDAREVPVQLIIKAARLFVRDHTDWVGSSSRLSGEVPHPECVPAKKLDQRWRQCSACADAFEAPTESVYVLCNACGALTELDDEEAQPAAGS